MSTRLDIFRDIIAGRGERPHLTAAWQHFVGREYDPVDFAQASVEFVQRWDWDWVKINPRAVYYAEAWGGVYDPDNYEGVVPALLKPAIGAPEEVKKIAALDPNENAIFAEHIGSARAIKQALPDRAVIQTIFSPLSVLYQLADLPLYPGQKTSTTSFTQADLLDGYSVETKHALAAIAGTLAAYVKELLRPASEGGAGLDGIFYAVTGTASQGLVTREQFDEFSVPYDRQILAAGREGIIVFHTCQDDSHPDWFADWPIDALQWDQALPANPGVDTDFGVTPVAGPSSTLFAPGQDLNKLASQIETTVKARTGKPFLLAPSCTIPTPATDEALSLLRRA